MILILYVCCACEGITGWRVRKFFKCLNVPPINTRVHPDNNNPDNDDKVLISPIIPWIQEGSGPSSIRCSHSPWCEAWRVPPRPVAHNSAPSWTRTEQQRRRPLSGGGDKTLNKHQNWSCGGRKRHQFKCKRRYSLDEALWLVSRIDSYCLPLYYWGNIQTT